MRILVTGPHRSGTRWVGQVLAASATPVGFIWEPFSPKHRPGTFPPGWSHYFHYVCDENAEEVREPWREMLEFRYQPVAELRTVRTPKGAARMARDWRRFRALRRRRASPLVKDPIALFSTEWLVRSFDMQPVVMVRHPGALVATITRRNWHHRFADFLDQPYLMRDLLSERRDEIERLAAEPPSAFDGAIVLWNILTAHVADLARRHPDWIMLRHEDACREPAARFRAVYERLGLSWTPEVERFLDHTTSSSNPTWHPRADSILRHSAAHVDSWKRELTRDQIAEIRARTEQIASEFYTDADW